MKYTNPPLDVQDLILMMKQRGLSFADEHKAQEQMLSLSYYRLASYLRPMEVDATTHQYILGASYEGAVMLYEFDRELRRLIFGAIQDVEIALRSRMIHYFSMPFGAFWFMDTALAKDAGIHANNQSKISQELARSKEDFVKDHFSKYDDPAMPPVWKTLEVVSFGTLSKLFENMADTGVKKQVARSFGLPQYKYLESWFKCATVLRNACCHHARVWNRRFPWKPQMPERLPHAWIANAAKVKEHKLYAQLCYLAYMELSINPQCGFVDRLKDLLAKYPTVDVAAMGFPSGWEMEPLWR